MKYVFGLIVEHKVKALMVSLTVGVLLVGFQNCSKAGNVQMSDMSAANGKVGSSGNNDPSSIDTNDLPPGSNEIQQPGADENNYQVMPRQPGDVPQSAPDVVQQQSSESSGSSSSSSDSGSNSAASMPNDPPPSVPSVSGPSDNPPSPPSDQDAPPSATPPPSEPPVASVPPSDDSGGSISNEEACQAVVDCSNYKSSSNANSDSRGKGILNAGDFDNHSNVDVISDLKGKHVICGLEVNHLVHSNGKLILVGSHIKDLGSFGGNVRVVSADECKPAASKNKKGDNDDDQGENNNDQGQNKGGKK